MRYMTLKIYISLDSDFILWKAPQWLGNRLMFLSGYYIPETVLQLYTLSHLIHIIIDNICSFIHQIFID